MYKNVIFIGGGRITRILLKGLKSQNVLPEKIIVIEPDIKTDNDKALDIALNIILSKIIEQNTDERFLNRLGYSLLNENKIDLAIHVFKENIKKHPGSANCYDSLGEACMINGDNELAIKNYKKSLEFDPNNENAKQMIEKILTEQKIR